MLHPLRIVKVSPLLVISTLATAECARATDLDPAALSESEARETVADAGVEEGALAGPPCGGNTGETLTLYNGVPFYSNGSCTGTWRGSFQCPEVVKRYSQHLDWHGHASTYCDPDTARQRNLIFLENQRESPGLDGDIVAFDGPDCGRGVGHVGLRCGTPDARHWWLCDQNRTLSSADEPLPLTRIGGALDTFQPRCLVCGSSRPGWDFSAVHGLGKDTYGWTLARMSLAAADDTALRLDPVDVDPHLISPAGLRLNPDPRAGGYGQLHVRLKSGLANRSLRVDFITASDDGWDDVRSAEGPIPRRSGWSEVVVALAANPLWRGGDRIDQIRLTPVKRGGPPGHDDEIAIDWIRFDP